MKNFKLFTILLFAALMFSCIKSEDNGTGAGDAIIVAKKSGPDTVYGITLYAYTFSSFKSVTAVSTSLPEHTYTLKANQGYKTNFYYETPESELTTTKPAASTYNFSAVFDNGATDEFQDVLSDKVLEVPTIEKCEFNTTLNQLEITWASLTDADSYAINILDGSTAVFGSIELAKTLKSYSIKASGDGWANGFTPVAGHTYTVKLFAFLYENAADAYNVQASSVAETTVNWGN